MYYKESSNQLGAHVFEWQSNDEVESKYSLHAVNEVKPCHMHLIFWRCASTFMNCMIDMDLDHVQSRGADK